VKRTIHIQPLAPAKPAWGQPCNGCGVCCLAEPCPLGMLLSRRRRGACVALRWQAPPQRYVCGAVAEPATVWPRWSRWAQPVLVRLARRWIAAGVGCDADWEAG